MAEDAGIDIDFDAADQDLAAVQGRVAGIVPAPSAEIAAVDGTIVTDDRAIEFMGRSFRVADKIGLMPLLKFSAFADMDTQDPRALGAMYSMLRDCIYRGTPGCGSCELCAPGRCGECRNCELAAGSEDPEDGPACTVYRPDPTACKAYDRGDWGAFEDHAIETKADADDLMGVINATLELISGRPTPPPASSSAGRRSTRDASMARSSARGRKGSRR
jgi:hypothetical protein